MKRLAVLAAIAGIGTMTMAAAGLQAPRGGARGGGAALTTQKVKDNLYMIGGGGGNTAAFITAAGVVLVDTKNPGMGQGILDQVKTFTDKPVTTVINTHTHADHTGSNNAFTGAVTFVAHENTKANMEKMKEFAGANAAFLPKVTYKEKHTLGTGNERIDLYYFGPGHTSGDTFVVFPALRTMHSGDIFAGKSTPIIDTGNGGSAVNYGKTLAKAAAGITNVDTIITGHSTLMTPADLKEYADFNNDFVTWVEGQIKAGKSVDEAAAAFQIPAKYQGYTIGTFLGGIRGNIQTAYNELQKK